MPQLTVPQYQLAKIPHGPLKVFTYHAALVATNVLNAPMALGAGANEITIIHGIHISTSAADLELRLADGNAGSIILNILANSEAPGQLGNHQNGLVAIPTTAGNDVYLSLGAPDTLAALTTALTFTITYSFIPNIS